MAFVPISIDAFVKKHLEVNPKENPKDLRKQLNRALAAYKSRVKCSCGNDIWVVGSAFVGNSCFTCITGEDEPTGDYEINSAIKKREKGLRHIDDMDPTKIAGFFDDDGYEIKMQLIKKPTLCLTCINNDDPNEDILCNMNRHSQKDDKEFICHAYKNMKS